MFCLKVDWKKRLVVSIISYLVFIGAAVWLLILAKANGILSVIVACFVYMFGAPDISFFGIDKSKKLGYYGGKVESEWKPDLMSTLMRIGGFSVIVIYLIISLVAEYA